MDQPGRILAVEKPTHAVDASWTIQTGELKWTGWGGGVVSRMS